VGLFNKLMTLLFGLFFKPFQSFEPIWALAVISLIAGVLMLWLFGKVSNQETISVVRDRIRGNLLGVRLFGDDIGLLFLLQGRVMRQTLTYLRHALIPILVMIVPVMFILIQMNLFFSQRPLEAGESSIVKVTLRDPGAMSRGVSLEAPAGVSVETEAVRVSSLMELSWRIRAEEPGRHQLLLKVDGEEEIGKELAVGEGWGATSSLRTGKSIVEKLLYPGEDPIPSSHSIQSIEVIYPPLPITAFGWNLNWIFVFLVLSIVFGYAFKGVIGVEI
jgi:hypothetical protein